MRNAGRDPRAAIAARVSLRRRRRAVDAQRVNPANARRPRGAQAVGAWANTGRARRAIGRGEDAGLALLAAGAFLVAFLGWLQHSVFGWFALVVAVAATSALAWRSARGGRGTNHHAIVPREALDKLDRLTTVATPELPAAAVTTLESLRLQLARLAQTPATQGDTIDAVAIAEAATMAQILQRYLPDALEHFLAVPAYARGSVESDLLQTQLDQLSRQLAAIETRRTEERRHALALHGRFLRSRRANDGQARTPGAR